MQGSSHLLLVPHPDLVPSPQFAWAEKPMQELLGCFWQNLLFPDTARKRLPSRAHQPEVASVTSFLTHELACAFSIHSGTDEKRYKHWGASPLSVWCGMRTAAVSSEILTQGFHGTREHLAPGAFPQITASSSPPDACPDPAHMQDQTDHGKQPEKKQLLG